jgi:hypothetical protein
MVEAHLLVEEARDDHDVRRHHASGVELVDDFEDSRRDVPAECIPRLLEVETPCAVRERCRLRRLRKVG